MLMCKAIGFIVVFALWQANGSPIPEKSDIERTKSMKSIKRSLCNYFSNPAQEDFAFFSNPEPPSSYWINLRSLRNRCRYFEEPSQKYSVWDLTRK